MHLNYINLCVLSIRSIQSIQSKRKQVGIDMRHALSLQRNETMAYSGPYEIKATNLSYFEDDKLSFAKSFSKQRRSQLIVKKKVNSNLRNFEDHTWFVVGNKTQQVPRWLRFARPTQIDSCCEPIRDWLASRKKKDHVIN